MKILYDNGTAEGRIITDWWNKRNQFYKIIDDINEILSAGIEQIPAVKINNNIYLFNKDNFGVIKSEESIQAANN